MKSVKAICSSAGCLVRLTTVYKITIKQIRTTQKIAVLMLEFTKPPTAHAHGVSH